MAYGNLNFTTQKINDLLSRINNYISSNGYFNAVRYNVPGTHGATGYMTSDPANAHNLYFNVNGKTLLTLTAVDMSVRLGSGVSGQVDFGTSSIPWRNGYFSATLSCKTLNQTSDMTMKEKIRDINVSVSDIANAPSFCFSWKDTKEISAGSSAQYWEKILPECVQKENGKLQMAYGNIALISVISLAKKVEDLEKILSNSQKET